MIPTRLKNGERRIASLIIFPRASSLGFVGVCIVPLNNSTVMSEEPFINEGRSWLSRYEDLLGGDILDNFDYGKSVSRDVGIAADAYTTSFKIRLKVPSAFIVHMGWAGRQTGTRNQEWLQGAYECRLGVCIWGI